MHTYNGIEWVDIHINEAWDGLLNTVCVYNKLLSHTLYICINCEIVIYGQCDAI